jgi:hypothetical protein
MASCERCSHPKIAGERFCRKHRWAEFLKMKRDGYLRKCPKVPWVEYKDPFLLRASDLAIFQNLEEMGKVVRIF